MTTDQHRRIRAAIRNHRRQPRTPGARIRDAILHAKPSHKKSPGANQGFKKISTVIDNERHANYRPPE